MPDNYSLWEAYVAKLDAFLMSRPVCDWCNQHIQEDHYYRIDGEIVCPDCLDTYFRKEIE